MNSLVEHEADQTLIEIETRTETSHGVFFSDVSSISR